MEVKTQQSHSEEEYCKGVINASIEKEGTFFTQTVFMIFFKRIPLDKEVLLIWNSDEEMVKRIHLIAGSFIALGLNKFGKFTRSLENNFLQLSDENKKQGIIKLLNLLDQTAYSIKKYLNED